MLLGSAPRAVAPVSVDREYGVRFGERIIELHSLQRRGQSRAPSSGTGACCGSGQDGWRPRAALTVSTRSFSTSPECGRVRPLPGFAVNRLSLALPCLCRSPGQGLSAVRSETELPRV